MEAGELTFAIIKPDSVAGKSIGGILSKIESRGFDIIGLKMLKMDDNIASSFYGIHKGKPFFNDLTTFMTSGKVVVLVLKKENAVKDFRNLIGDTNPKKAADGTIRKIYGSSIDSNAVHGSDSDENAMKEISFFFSNFELTGALDQ